MHFIFLFFYETQSSDMQSLVVSLDIFLGHLSHLFWKIHINYSVCPEQKPRTSIRIIELKTQELLFFSPHQRDLPGTNPFLLLVSVPKPRAAYSPFKTQVCSVNPLLLWYTVYLSHPGFKTYSFL